MTFHLQRVRRGKDFLGGDVRIAGDAILGGRCAAMPFVSIGRPTVRSVPGPVKCSAAKRSPFSHVERFFRLALCSAQAAIRIGDIHAGAAKMASASFCEPPHPQVRSGKHLPRQAGLG